MSFRIGLTLAILGAFALAGGQFVNGQEKKGAKVGDKAPAFEGQDEQGKAWKSTDHVGKKILVLYFYPADFTGGCTSQACGYRDAIEKLGGQGVQVVGISGDSPKTHALFKAYNKLPFTLLADEKGDIAKKFGVPVGKGGTSPTIDAKGEKGKADRGVTIQRWTVVIDKAGNIADLSAVKSTAGDPERIATLVKGLKQ